MDTQESTDGAAREEPTAPNHGQEDSTVGGETPDAPPTKVQELEERADRLMANWQRAQADAVRAKFTSKMQPRINV